jgi:class 3 adenylate cyclase
VLSVAEQQDWRCVLRVGVLPFADVEGLASLAEALRAGDPRLVRQATVEPLYVYREMAVARCCPLAWLHWRGRPGVTVGEVDAGWQALLTRCGEATGSVMAVSAFMDLWDAWGPDDVPLPAAELLAEVEAELARRAAGEVVS